MKPLGPIPAGYAMIDGQLAVGGRTARALVAEAGRTPVFVYSAALIRRRIGELLAALPSRVAVHYAVKANPYEPVLRLMSELVDGFDIASAGELDLVRAAGIAADRISFAGPGKRTAELEAAVRAGVTINLESEAEAVRALEAGQRLGRTPRCGSPAPGLGDRRRERASRRAVRRHRQAAGSLRGREVAAGEFPRND